MRQVKFESEKDADTLYIKPDVYDDYDLDGELCDGLLLAQDQDGNAYILEHDQVVYDVDDLALTWHRFGACETRDNGEPFGDRVSAIRWALDQGWWVWHAKDGAEAQRWIGQQLRKQAEKAKEVAMV